jgi:hypothetical protein
MGGTSSGIGSVKRQRRAIGLNRRLIELVCPFEVEMEDKATSIGTRLEAVVQ